MLCCHILVGDSRCISICYLCVLYVQGGIGPGNIESVLSKVKKAAEGREIWIDMESSLRSTKNGNDIFDLDKCYECILATCATGLHEHPAFLI
jgi:hypothetical protein